MDHLDRATKRVYYRKQIPLSRLIEKMKLWPSRTGVLHGIKEFNRKGAYISLTTYCSKVMLVRDSKNSRSARWLRNKWFFGACEQCCVPDWKLEKYSATLFKRGWGSFLTNPEEARKT